MRSRTISLKSGSVSALVFTEGEGSGFQESPRYLVVLLEAASFCLSFFGSSVEVDGAARWAVLLDHQLL